MLSGGHDSFLLTKHARPRSAGRGTPMAGDSKSSAAADAERSRAARTHSRSTLGVEEEFHLVDLRTRRLTPRAGEVLAALEGELATKLSETKANEAVDLLMAGHRKAAAILLDSWMQVAEGRPPSKERSG